jgi:phage terminase large subunit-like protein
VKLAVDLIEQQSGKFEPLKMPNEYAQAVHELVQAKVEQRAPEVAIAPESGETPKVINIMANQGCHIPLLPFGQGYKSMGPACTHFAEMALLGKIHHGNHPVLKACVLDSVMVQDDADNLKFSKSKSTGIRIEGVVALTMALGAPRPKPRDFKMMFI